jgi:hypothetical protein
MHTQKCYLERSHSQQSSLLIPNDPAPSKKGFDLSLSQRGHENVYYTPEILMADCKLSQLFLGIRIHQWHCETSPLAVIFAAKERPVELGSSIVIIG